jgi:hypothetical protein
LAEQKMGFWGLFFSPALPNPILPEKWRIPDFDKEDASLVFELK